MTRKLAAWLVLMTICLSAGLLLGATNALTETPIEVNTAAEADRARASLMPDADRFEAIDVDADSGMDACFAVYRGDALIGCLAQATAQGYGGPIEVLAGMDQDGRITGVSVGGAGFSETPGLGAKTKDAAFRDQFVGLTLPATLGQNVDAVTNATISSTAVTSAVNQIGTFLTEQLASLNAA